MATPADWTAQFERLWGYFEQQGWVEVVAYVPYDSGTDGYGEPVTGVDATRTVVEKREDGGPFAETRRWTLRDSTLGGTVPTIRGKVVQADGTEWVITSITRPTNGSIWRCQTYRYASGS